MTGLILEAPQILVDVKRAEVYSAGSVTVDSYHDLVSGGAQGLNGASLHAPSLDEPFAEFVESCQRTRVDLFSHQSYLGLVI